MDNIKEKLKRAIITTFNIQTKDKKNYLIRNKSIEINPNKSSTAQISPAPILPAQIELPLSDILLRDNFLTHLDKNHANIYLRIKSKEFKKLLIMADAYVKQHGDKKIYEYLEQRYIHPNSWTALIAKRIEADIIQFTRELYKKNNPGQNTLNSLLEQVINQYLDFDFSAYRERIGRGDKYNLLVVCNNLLNIPPRPAKIMDLPGMIRSKLEKVSKIIKEYNIKAEQDGFEMLYILDGISELKH